MNNISKTNIKIFESAYELAQNGQHRVRVGAVVARKGTPLAGAFNTVRNDSPVDFKDQTYHAETNCLNSLMYEQVKRGGLTLYICRIGRRGELLPSYPCWRCMRFIHDQKAVSKLIFWDQQLEVIRL